MAEADLKDRRSVALDALLAGRLPGAPYATEPIPAAPTVPHDLPRQPFAQRFGRRSMVRMGHPVTGRAVRGYSAMPCPEAQELSACPADGSWPVTRRDPA